MYNVTEEQKTKKRNIAGWIVSGLLIVVCLAALAGVAVLFSLPEEETRTPGYHDLSEASITVEFSKITTLPEQYEQMSRECEAFLLSEDAPAGPETEADSLISVDESVYVDREDMVESAENELTVQYTEYDRVFFENMLMIRYVSQFGFVRVVGARLTEEGDKPVEILQINDLIGDYFQAEIKWDDWNILTAFEKEMEESDAVSGQAFIACVGQCIVRMLNGETDSNTFMSHFTADGELAVSRLKSALELDPACNVNVLLGAAGKSNLTGDGMDRLFFRIEVTSGEAVEVINILAKLDSSLLVFDLDII